MTPAFRRLCAAAVATFAVHVHASEQPDQLIELTPAQTAALAIEVEQASTATVIEVDTLLGRIDLPLVGTNVIASPYAGRITRIAADEGERVTAGQVLAVVSSREYADDHARLVELEAKLHVARRQSDRDRTLAAEGIIARGKAEASAATARELTASLAALRAIIKPWGQDGADATTLALTAPTAGIIVSLQAVTGERIDALAALFVLSADSRWRLNVQVPVALSARVASGAKLRIGDVTIPVTGRGLTVEEATQTVTLRGLLPADTGYLPGQQVLATLELPAPPGAIKVPRSALLRVGEEARVLKADGASYQALPVTVLGENRLFAVIDGPLVAGDSVVTAGVSALKSMLGH